MQTTKELTIFKDKKIRVEILNGEPLFCMQDICLAAGMKNNPHLKDRIDPKDMHIVQTLTPGGYQDMVYINESALYDVVVGSRKPKVKELRRELLVAIPALRKQSFESQRIAELEDRIEKLERGGGHFLLKPVPEISARSQLNIIIRKFISRQTSTYSYEDAWNELYIQHKYRYHIDLKERARKREKKFTRKFAPLDCATPEELEGLVDLANHVFRPLEEA